MFHPISLISYRHPGMKAYAAAETAAAAAREVHIHQTPPNSIPLGSTICRQDGTECITGGIESNAGESEFGKLRVRYSSVDRPTCSSTYAAAGSC